MLDLSKLDAPDHVLGGVFRFSLFLKKIPLSIQTVLFSCEGIVYLYLFPSNGSSDKFALVIFDGNDFHFSADDKNKKIFSHTGILYIFRNSLPNSIFNLFWPEDLIDGLMEIVNIFNPELISKFFKKEVKI